MSNVLELSSNCRRVVVEQRQGSLSHDDQCFLLRMARWWTFAQTSYLTVQTSRVHSEYANKHRQSPAGKYIYCLSLYMSNIRLKYTETVLNVASSLQLNLFLPFAGFATFHLTLLSAYNSNKIKYILHLNIKLLHVTQYISLYQWNILKQNSYNKLKHASANTVAHLTTTPIIPCIQPKMNRREMSTTISFSLA